MKRFLVLVMASILAVCLIAGVLFLKGEGDSCPFSMQVIPEHISDSIAGQRCVFLVVVADEGQGSGEGKAVNISATAPGASVTVDPQAIPPGKVAEVTVIPDKMSENETLTATVRGERGGLKQTETVTVKVNESIFPDPWSKALTAAEMRNKFIPWLAANHPELGITSETEWTGIIIAPNSHEVSFYLFFSEDWEMGVSWHVTIPPHDWARIYLRDRITKVSPSHAFEIPSWSEQGEPHAIDPPESVWR